MRDVDALNSFLDTSRGCYWPSRDAGTLSIPSWILHNSIAYVEAPSLQALNSFLDTSLILVPAVVRVLTMSLNSFLDTSRDELENLQAKYDSQFLPGYFQPTTPPTPWTSTRLSIPSWILRNKS